MRTRYIQHPETGELIPAHEYRATHRPTHYVMPDLPDYESPIDGRVVHGRAGRREDLRRSGSRPYEGREAEAREAARARKNHEAAQERAIERTAQAVWANMSPEKKRAAMRGM
jgi:hypothetical protein